MALSPHMEMYLKAMLVRRGRGPVTPGPRLKLDSRPSVTKAVATLAVRPRHARALSPRRSHAEGPPVGREVMRRHQILRAFLTGVLGVPAAIADEDSCALEHVVSRTTLTSLTDFLAFLGQCPQAPLEVVRHFQEVASCKDSPCCARCGLDKLVAPNLPESETPMSKQHTRF